MEIALLFFHGLLKYSAIGSGSDTFTTSHRLLSNVYFIESPVEVTYFVCNSKEIERLWREYVIRRIR